MKERLDYIDRAKGILIILVVIGHIWQSGCVFEFIYTFHMPAFFVISGVLLAHTRSYEKNFGVFLGKHVFSYGIPFLFFELMGVMVQIMRHGVTMNWKGYLFQTVTLRLNASQCWFLVTLFLIEILVYAAVRVVKNPTAICLTCGMMFVARHVLPTDVMYIGTISTTVKYLPFFLAGFYGHRYWNCRKPVLTAACAAVVLISTLFGGNLANRLLKDADLLLGGVAGTYMTVQLAQCRFPDRTDRILRAAGKNTIIIYGTHYLYYAALGVLLGVQDFTATPIGVGLLMLAGVALLEIPTIYIINRWLPFLAGKVRRKTRSA